MKIDPGDIYRGENAGKVAASLEEFTLTRARPGAEFDAGWEPLFAEFGPTGEIERKETVEIWNRGSRSPPGARIPAEYHMVLAHDRAGRLAGVRDCFTTVDREAKRAVVLLSHSLVMPEYRRTGLAALLRTIPVSLAREMLGGPGEIMLVAEMEMVDPGVRISVIRLIAYGRAGFSVIQPESLPYAQPDFRDFSEVDDEPVPLPFLALVRLVGRETETTLSRTHAEAVVTHLQAIHGCHCRPEHLVPIREHALGALARWPGDTVPLLRPPRDTNDLQALAPLLRAHVQHLYPPRWRWGDPDAIASVDLEKIIQLWSHDVPA